MPPGGGGNGGGGGEPPWKPEYSGGEEWEREVRKEREPWLREMATKHGITPKEYEVRVAEHLRKILPEMEPFRRFDEEALIALLDGDKLRSQFETHKSSGAYDPERRAKLEWKMWGIPETQIEDRPSYGYLHPRPEGMFAGDELSTYGHIVVRFKRDILKRTTVTLGDTLDDAGEAFHPRIAPCTVDDPSWTAIAEPLDPLDFPTAEALAHAATESDPMVHYFEAQYHGRVGREDIADILFLGDPPSDTLRELLKARGMEYVE